MSETVRRAREFAITAHNSQMYGDRPYSFHLDMMVKLLEPFGEEAQVVGYLHDVVEDTDVRPETVRREFGEVVANCVSIVTDEPGANRRERKARTNVKLAKAAEDMKLALIVKAADRLANLQMSAQDKSGSKLEMYRREHAAFRQAAFRTGLFDGLWEEMDRILGLIE
jgi:(p)ppGpp synthase/HD superfamily hydrolase